MCTWGWNREFSLDQDESFWLENYKRVENSPLVFSHVELWIDFGGGSFMKIFEMGTRLLFGTSQNFLPAECPHVAVSMACVFGFSVVTFLSRRGALGRWFGHRLGELDYRER